MTPAVLIFGTVHRITKTDRLVMCRSAYCEAYCGDVPFERAPGLPLQEIQFLRSRHGLRAIARLQFAQDVADMVLGGAFGNEQLLRNLFVA